MTTEEVLWQCLRYFAYLDESNAAMHCAEVRYSPITFRLAEVLNEADWLNVPDATMSILRRVLSHRGKYAEDPGR